MRGVEKIYAQWSFHYGSNERILSFSAAGLVLNQDNEVKISIISNVVSIYINGSLKKSATVSCDKVSALDVYLQTAGSRVGQYPSADGYIQNLKYIPGGEA